VKHRKCFTAGSYGRVAGEAAVMLSPSGSYILHTGVTDACRARQTSQWLHQWAGRPVNDA